MSQPLIIHSDSLAWETWSDDDFSRGRVFWKTLFSRGRTDSDSLTAGVAIVHPGDALNPHHHAPAEIYFVFQGEGIMTLGKEEQRVRAGDAIFIPGDVRHGIANRNDKDLLFLYAFPTDSFEEIVYHFTD